MTTGLKSNEQEHPKQKVIYRSAASAPVYGLGLIGAWVYYMAMPQHSGLVRWGSSRPSSGLQCWFMSC